MSKAYGGAVMERNRDSRKTAISAVNGLPRRPQRITTLRDSPEGELHEKVRLRDREKLNNKKDRNREYLKRRRVDRSTERYRENESTDTSDEEYYEDEEDGKTRIYQTNQRGIHSLRSPPAVLRAAAVDEVIGVVVPRRTRSSLARRSHEQLGSGLGEDLAHQRLSPAAAVARVPDVGGDFVASSPKKKMKSSAGTRTRVLNGESNSRPSMDQADIEIEVAEALFDLMQQTQLQKHEDRETTVPADNEERIRLTKVERCKDENNAVSVKNEQSLKIHCEKLLDCPQDLMRSVNKEKVVGSSVDSASPSCFEANACDNQEPTVTKAKNVATVVENEKEKMLDRDLFMAITSSEKDAAIVSTNPNTLKRSGATPMDGPVSIQPRKEKEGPININQQVSNGMGKSPHDPLSCVTNAQNQKWKEQKNQLVSSLLPLPIGMGGWPGVVPYPGYIPVPQSVLPVDGSSRSSITGLRFPQFKPAQTRTKRCVTHQYIASNIHHHQRLMKESLNSGPSNGAATLNAGKSLSLLNHQRFIPGYHPWLGPAPTEQMLANISGVNEKDKKGIAASFSNPRSNVLGLQQNPNQVPANSLLHGPGFIFPFGYHHQAMGITPASASAASSYASLFSSSAGKLPSVASLSFNSLNFSSQEAAGSSYMAMLQNNGFSLPIPMPNLKGGPSQFPMPFLNSSLFNTPHNQQHLSSQSMASTSSPSSSQKQPSIKASTDKNSQTSAATDHPSSKSPNTGNCATINGSSSANDSVHQFAKLASGSSFPVQLMNFAAIPPQMMMSGVSVANNNHGDPKQRESKNRVELIPFGSNASPILNFSPMAQNSAIGHQLSSSHQKNGKASERKSSIHTDGGNGTMNLHKSGSTDISKIGNSQFDGLPLGICYRPSSGASVSVPNIQLLQQLQKQHQYHMQQLNGTMAQDKVSSSSSNIVNASIISSSNPPTNYHQLPENVSTTSLGVTSLQSPSSSSLANVKASQSQEHVSQSTGGSLRDASPASKNDPAQEPEDSSPPSSSENGPACRKDVPSILSMCNGQVSELKY